MKVKELISIFSRAEKILKLYGNETVDEMLEDIYLKLVTINIKDKSLTRVNNSNKKTVSNSIAQESLYKKVIDEIKNKEKQEIIRRIQKLKKDDLMNIGKLINLKLNKSSRKDIMVESIAGYFSFINLNQKVNERDEGELQKFLNLNK